jgi:RNA polymerase sigma factor (sigma-70 family)
MNKEMPPEKILELSKEFQERRGDGYEWVINRIEMHLDKFVNIINNIYKLDDEDEVRQDSWLFLFDKYNNFKFNEFYNKLSVSYLNRLFDQALLRFLLRKVSLKYNIDQNLLEREYSKIRKMKNPISDLIEDDSGINKILPFHELDSMLRYICKYEHILMSKDIDNMLNVLRYRAQTIIRLRFYEGLTLSEIGKQFGINVERVRQIEARSLRLLRNYYRYKGFQSYIYEDHMDYPFPIKIYRENLFTYHICRYFRTCRADLYSFSEYGKIDNIDFNDTILYLYRLYSNIRDIGIDIIFEKFGPYLEPHFKYTNTKGGIT